MSPSWRNMGRSMVSAYREREKNGRPTPPRTVAPGLGRAWTGVCWLYSTLRKPAPTPHPYDAGYAGGLRSAIGSDPLWLRARLREWVAYPTDTPAALERRMGLIDALADALSVPDRGRFRDPPAK